MSIEEDYKAKIEEIKAIPDVEICYTRTIPFENYLIESDKLNTCCLKYKEDLLKIGLNWKLVEDLPRRMNAFQHAQTSWNTLLFKQKSMVSEWQATSPKAYDLRKTLIAVFRYAFRKHPTLLTQVNSIASKQTQAGILIGLNDLGLIGKDNIELLKNINFDIAKLEEAIKQSFQLRAILSHKGLNEDKSPIKKMRDKAFTFLKIAVDEICAAGQFAFADEPEKKALFTSEYLRRYRNKKKNIKVTNEISNNLNQ